MGDQPNKKREVSHMSYVYGDEESQHHNIPEYSADPSQYEQKQQFEPKLPEIEEREASHASTTYKTESHTKHTVIDVEESVDNVIVGALDNHNKSPKNKMVIKIYPPSLQAVASKSPTAGDEQERYFDFFFLFIFIIFFSVFLIYILLFFLLIPFYSVA